LEGDSEEQVQRLNLGRRVHAIKQHTSRLLVKREASSLDLSVCVLKASNAPVISVGETIRNLKRVSVLLARRLRTTPSLEGKRDLRCDGSGVEVFFQFLENDTP
jgi:hypothetical protein